MRDAPLRHWIRERITMKTIVLPLLASLSLLPRLGTLRAADKPNLIIFLADNAPAIWAGGTRESTAAAAMGRPQKTGSVPA